MSATTVRATIVECDAEGCVSSDVFEGTQRAAFQEAREAGWSIDNSRKRSDRDLAHCPAHRSTAGRKMKGESSCTR